MVAPHVPVPPYTSGVEITLGREMGEPRITLRGQGSNSTRHGYMQLGLEGARRLRDDLTAIIALAEKK